MMQHPDADVRGLKYAGEADETRQRIWTASDECFWHRIARNQPAPANRNARLRAAPSSDHHPADAAIRGAERKGAFPLTYILPQRGSFVAPIRLRDVEEAQFIRESLEVAVSRRVAASCSKRFLTGIKGNLHDQDKAVKAEALETFLELDEAYHRSFCEEAGLLKSWRVIQSVKLQMDRVRYLSLPDLDHLRVLLSQHRSIVEAIEAGDVEGAGRSMALHLREVLRTAQNLSQQRSDLVET